MKLLDYFDTVYVPIKRSEGLAASGLDVIRRSVRWLAASLKRDPTLADLSDSAISALWRFIVRQGRSRNTATWNCQRLVSIWRFAHARGDVAGDKLQVAALKRRHSAKLVGMARIPVNEPRERRHGIPPVKEAAAPANPATTETLLVQFLFRHYAVSHDVSRTSIDKAYRSAVTSFERSLNRPATVGDLTTANVNAWLFSLVEQVSRETAHGYRRTVLMLWRYAYDSGLLAEYPRKVRPIKRPRRIIEGYDADQMAKLLRTADIEPGVFPQNGIERRLWFVAFLLAAWATGLRLGDLLRIEREWIRTDDTGAGRLSLVMHKTGDAIDRLLPAGAVAAIDRLMASGPSRKLCFPLWTDQRDYYREFKLLARQAGLGGTTKYIRRGSSSEVERQLSGGGRNHLGHRSAGLFETAYRVDRIVGKNIPLPPEPVFVPTLRIGHVAVEGGAT